MLLFFTKVVPTVQLKQYIALYLPESVFEMHLGAFKGHTNLSCLTLLWSRSSVSAAVSL